MDGDAQPSPVRQLYRTYEFEPEFGAIRLEEWPEGIVLYVAGRMRWASFRDAEFWNTRRS